jgi:hypothetical protein
MRKLVGLATRLYWQLAYNIRYACMFIHVPVVYHGFYSDERQG